MFLLFFQKAKSAPDLEGLNFTNQFFAHLLMISKSISNISAARVGLSTIMYKVVSSAKSRTHDCISGTILCMYNKHSSRSRIDP